jgi:hypothetical protein
VWKISGKTIIILERRGYDRLFLIGAVWVYPKSRCTSHVQPFAATRSRSIVPLKMFLAYYVANNISFLMSLICFCWNIRNNSSPLGSQSKLLTIVPPSIVDKRVSLTWLLKNLPNLYFTLYINRGRACNSIHSISRTRNDQSHEY